MVPEKFEMAHRLGIADAWNREIYPSSIFQLVKEQRNAESYVVRRDRIRDGQHSY